MLKVGVLGNKDGKRTGFYIATKQYNPRQGVDSWLAFNLDEPGWSLRIGQRWFGNSGIVYIAKANRWWQRRQTRLHLAWLTLDKVEKELAKRKDRTES